MQRLKNYLFALLVIMAAVVAARLMEPYFDRANVAKVYTLAVVIVALRLGGGPAAMACVLSVLLFDLVNVPPYFELTARVYEYLFPLAVMLITTGIISRLAGRLRQAAAEARERETRTAALYALSAELAGTQSVAEALDRIGFHLEAAFQAEAELTRLMETESGAEQPVPTFQQVSDSVRVTAALVIEGSPRYRVQLAAPARCLEARAQQEHLGAMLNQGAQALERIILRQRVQEAEILLQKKALRNSILNVLSHDLRTPLASIIGASSSLLAEGESYAPAARQRLCGVIHDEALHMLQLVEKLLGMARLQGGIQLSREWEALEEIVGSAVATMRRRVKTHELVVEVPHDLPFIRCDSVLIESVLVNLLENAVKYSRPGTSVWLAAALYENAVQVTVTDQGDGVPEAQRERIFEPFFRLHTGVAGGGLGLAICRGIVEAHDGRIWVESAVAKGTAIHFTLPLSPEAFALAPVPEKNELEEQ